MDQPTTQPTLADGAGHLPSSMEQYRSIVQNALEGIFQSSPDGRYLLANPALARLYGYDSPSELVDSVADISRTIYVDPAMRAEFKVRMERDGEVAGMEYQVRRRDGRIIWVCEHSRAVRDEQGRVLYYEGFIQDVTGRKLVQDQLRAAKEGAELANIAKSRFLAMMSHEIRTPMNGVIGMAALLMETELTAEQREFARTIQQSGEALLTVINDILDFSKIESGHLEIERTVFNLRTCIEDALGLLAPKAAEKGLELVYDMAAGGPEMILGDPVRFRQVVVNLLGNALKFTEHGEVVLTASSRFVAGGEVEWLISVRDTGIGIPREVQGRIFQSFTQVDASTTRKYGGTGLGLAISKRLVTLQRGTIGVESAPGLGSTFWFAIPFPCADRTPSRPPGGAALTGRRLLIIDDNATSRRVLAAFVGAEGLQAETVDSGAAALAALKGGARFDAALVDCRMPDMDGLELAPLLAGATGGEPMPLILMSDFGHCGVAGKSLFSGNVAKPFRRAQLLAALHATFAPSPPARTPASRRNAASPVAANALRLLLAEDNPVNRKVVTLQLARLGYHADIAVDGRQALEAASLGKYDAVLLDVQMPELDGFDVARRLHARLGAACPWLIATTANAMEGDREDCIAAGMHDYLSKPLTVKKLAEALERAVTREVPSALG